MLPPPALLPNKPTWTTLFSFHILTCHLLSNLAASASGFLVGRSLWNELRVVSLRAHLVVDQDRLVDLQCLPLSEALYLATLVSKNRIVLSCLQSLYGTAA